MGLSGTASILLLQEVTAWGPGVLAGRIVFTDATCPCAVVVPRGLINIGPHFCSATTAAVHIGDVAYLSAYLADSGKTFASFIAKSTFNVNYITIEV